MEVKVLWTPQALKGLDKAINYLEKEWTTREIKQLESKIEKFIESIKEYPLMFPQTSRFKNTHKGLIDKNN